MLYIYTYTHTRTHTHTHIYIYIYIDIYLYIIYIYIYIYILYIYVYTYQNYLKLTILLQVSRHKWRFSSNTKLSHSSNTLILDVTISNNCHFKFFMHHNAIKHRRHYYHTYESEITKQLLFLPQIKAPATR